MYILYHTNYPTKSERLAQGVELEPENRRENDSAEVSAAAYNAAHHYSVGVFVAAVDVIQPMSKEWRNTHAVGH